MFEVGEAYTRRELHERYGGQQRGSISTPSKHPFIMLFWGETGQKHGYRDVWVGDDKFLYTGEGQKGDMAMLRGNRAIRDHAANGKELHLFKNLGKGKVKYEGEMVCTEYREEVWRDHEGRQRKAIVFELTRRGAL
jgi:5-methylcytosine-specific restriction enzyme A